MYTTGSFKHNNQETAYIETVSYQLKATVT